ncbi:hypothetical protein GGTG_13181 [Gaeumannomyces tritici R3-111a-1]|uniref:Uncharacterized protein n=1 Tax=Gaeumannomyces tritici (strain R3-111a-1) TaxID=644352 RepID=J3PI51_GAET3|nr:hypothetical protein GGTG_13181 [Gaeumannomyces tritici R3-111a-1]EJT69563.1 hypothetical protein GGTG_13181 [Gaeumannomyces tritici R3-111a-1]
MLPLLALSHALATPLPSAPALYGFNYSLSSPSTYHALVAWPLDAAPLIPSASNGAHLSISGTDRDPRTTAPPVPHSLFIELPRLIRGGYYKRVDLRVGCARATAVDTARLANFNGRCNSAQNGSEPVWCRVPLAAIANEPSAGCTPGETFTDCRRWGNLSGPEKTLKIALWAGVHVGGRDVQLWGLGDRCVADERVRPTLQHPTCPDVGGFEMTQEFEVGVVCSMA